ncbi:hypothetical protein TKK_0018654 [Trichogramma kaykai]
MSTKILLDKDYSNKKLCKLIALRNYVKSDQNASIQTDYDCQVLVGKVFGKNVLLHIENFEDFRVFIQSFGGLCQLASAPLYRVHLTLSLLLFLILNGTTKVDDIELVSSYSNEKSQQVYNYILRKCANEPIDSDDENKVKITRGLLRKTPPSLKAARIAILDEFGEVIRCPNSHQKLKEDLRTELQHHLVGLGSSSLSSLPVTENVSLALQSEIERKKCILPDQTSEKEAVTAPDQRSVEAPLPSVLKEIPLPKSAKDRSYSLSQIEPVVVDCEMETEKCILSDHTPEKTAVTIPNQRSVEAPLPSFLKEVPLPKSPEDWSDSLSRIELLAPNCEMETDKCTLLDNASEKTVITTPDQRSVQALFPSIFKEIPLPESVSASENFILPLDSPEDKMYFSTPQTTNPSQPLSQTCATVPVASCSNEQILHEHAGESTPYAVPIEDLKKKSIGLGILFE